MITITWIVNKTLTIMVNGTYDNMQSYNYNYHIFQNSLITSNLYMFHYNCMFTLCKCIEVIILQYMTEILRRLNIWLSLILIWRPPWTPSWNSVTFNDIRKKTHSLLYISWRTSYCCKPLTGWVLFATLL